MAVPGGAQQRLSELLADWDSGQKNSPIIRDFLILTQAQLDSITEALRNYWSNQNYTVPGMLDAKLLHAYESRVKKDGFASSDILSWLIAAGDDNAEVVLDFKQRPALQCRFVDAIRGFTYLVKMPIRSDAAGRVYIDDVIPIGVYK